MTTKSALLIVDVQRDFCSGGALPVPLGDSVVSVCNMMIAGASNIFFSRCWHPPKTEHFNKWPPHCIAHSIGAEFHEDLWVPNSAVILAKGELPGDDAYSAFDGYDYNYEHLDYLLQDRKIDGLVVMGLATDYCVKETVLEACTFDYDVVVVEDGIRAVNLKEGDGDAAIAEMKQAGARFILSRNVLF